MMKNNHSAPKGKEISEKAGVTSLGGKTKAFGKSGVTPSKPGVSAPPSKPAFNKAPPKGGSKGMAPFTGVSPSKPGGVAINKGAGNKKFGADTGSGHMAGKGTAANAKPR
jgi:hypothetical protein